MKTTARAFAPASIGNLGVGFDVLGLAIEGPGDCVTVKRRDRPGIEINDNRVADAAANAGKLSRIAEKNTASIAAAALWAAVGEPGGLEMVIEKGIPLGSGMGSSAASAVAGVVAANALLSAPLSMDALMPYAMQGESFASGAMHADNVAPSLLGGMVLCPHAWLPEVRALPLPTDIRSVLVHPHLRINTADSRRGLSNSVPLPVTVAQMAAIAGFVHACHSNDMDLIRRTLVDHVVEPQRSSQVAGFADVRDAAMQAGALGCSLSGSGPSLFALASVDDAPAVALAMQGAFTAHAIPSDYWISSLAAPGARVLED